MKNDFSKLGGCSACALRASGECKLTAILHCDFFKPAEAVEQGLHPTSETLPDLEALSTPEHSATSQS